MPELKVEMVPFEAVAEEIKKAKHAGGGKWAALIKDVLESGQAARVRNLSDGQIAAASKACKGTKVSARTFYGKGQVILYVPKK